MHNDKIDLNWIRFGIQCGTCMLALACSIVAELHFLTTNSGDQIIATGLIFIPFLFAAHLLKVPYLTDEFERRLRNWSMTQSAVWLLIGTVSVNLVYHTAKPNDLLISPYIMPALFLGFHALYSQYLRHRVATNKANRFTG